MDIRATFSVDGAAHRVVARSTLESPVEYSSARFPSEDGHENSFDEEDDFYDNEVWVLAFPLMGEWFMCVCVHFCRMSLG